MKRDKVNNKKKNLGIEILRIILSFWIVIIHSYYFKDKKKLKKQFDEKMFHVPTFMIISFYFSYNYLESRDRTKIIQRLKRLITPYIIWPFLFLMINNSLKKLLGLNNSYIKTFISLIDFFCQIILSSRYYPPFWFINVLLFLLLIFIIISYIFRNSFLFVIQLFGFFCYILHHSGIYNYLREKNLFELCLVLIIQIIPAAVIGLSFGSINLIKVLKSCYSRFRIILMGFLFLLCLFKFDIFQPSDGFLYQKVELNAIGAMDLFISFSLLPFENFQNTNVGLIIRLLSNNTGGVYYIHNFIRGYLVKLLLPIRNGIFLGSILLYIISYFICFSGSKIFKNTFLKYLFI